VTSIAYNARGQRAAVAYGNGVGVSYAFDPLTFRLTRLTALRPASFAANAQTVQDLRYFYDPVGNITRIRDDADIQNVVFFANQRVEPSSDYTYDPLYRLISARGREHLGQTGSALNAAAQVTDDDSFRSRLPQPGDGKAMGTYIENYSYDALGNILSMAHVVASGGWTRNYTYNEASRIVAAETGNRLSRTSLPGDPASGPFSAAYAYDAHGNMIKMPHLQAMVWSEDDRLRATTRTAGGATPPTTYYAYASGGDRVRKVVENQTGARTRERIYLGGIEVYREFATDGTTIDLSRETFPAMAGEQVAARVEISTLGNDPGPAQQVRYQFSNHLHSAALELGDTAEVISYEEHFPFGATSYQAVASATDVAKRYRFTGKERDEENLFYYHGARYYAPWLGRWTACDPIGIADGVNLYRYVRNNPPRLIDKAGHEGTAANDPPKDDPRAADKEKQQQTIAAAEKEIAALNQKSGPLQVEQWDLVEARNKLDQNDPKQKEEGAQLQKRIDANSETLKLLFSRTRTQEKTLSDSQAVLTELNKPEPEEVKLEKSLQVLAVLNQSPGGMPSYFSVDTQLSFTAKNFDIKKFDLGPGELALGHEPAGGLTASAQVLNPGDTAPGAKSPPSVSLHPQVSVGADVVNYTFKDKNDHDVLELKATIAPQVDFYGNFTGSKAQLQVPLLFGVEWHLNESLSAVGQVSIPLYTSGARLPSGASPNPPPSFGFGFEKRF
jgi:RHS repeat-associated protein